MIYIYGVFDRSHKSSYLNYMVKWAFGFEINSVSQTILMSLECSALIVNRH